MFCLEVGLVLTASQVLSGVKKNTHLPMQETEEMQVQPLGWEDRLEEGTATHSSILIWRIPRTEQPGGLESFRVPKSWTWLKRLPTHALELKLR